MGDSSALKGIQGNTYVYLETGIKRIQDLHLGHDRIYKCETQIYGRNGLRKCIQVVKGREEDSIKITTQYGFELEGASSHHVRITDSNGKEGDKKLLEIQKGDTLVMGKGMNGGAYEYVHSPLRCANALDLGRRLQINCQDDGQIPACILKAPVSCQKAFLSGLCQDNGLIIPSEQLGHQVQQMYLNLGTICQREGLPNGTWKVSPVAGSVEKGNIFFDTVANIEPGRCSIYDLSIDDGSSFVSNGLISHSC